MANNKNSKSAIDDADDDDDDHDDHEIYEVEALLNHRRSRTKGNKIDYFVKWQGYSEQYNTWEGESNILSEELAAEYWSKSPVSRLDFLKSRNDKKRKVESMEDKEEPKKKPKIGKKKKEVLSTEPPKGLKWEDIIEVANIYNTKEKELFSEIRWKNEEKTCVLSNIVRQHNPTPLIDKLLQLLNYYEKRLIFK